MTRSKEFKFDEGGILKLELSDSGELSIHLQARHLGEGMRYTSAGVVVDAEKAREIARWLAGDYIEEDSSE